MAFHAENISGNKWRVTRGDKAWTVNCPTSDSSEAAAIALVDSMIASAGAPTEQELALLQRQAITAERDRRIALGTTVTIAGYGAVPLQGRATDQINLIALGDTARDLVAAGVTDPVIPFRDALNVIHNLTPTQVLDLVKKGKAVVSAIYVAAWALKDGATIPSNFTHDTHWP